MSASYFDIFPGAKLRISVVNDKFGMRPSDVRQLLYHLCTEATGNRAMCPKSLRIEHRALCKHVVFVIFEGLDKERYEGSRRFTKEFAEMDRNGFPIVVQAHIQNHKIIRGAETLFGCVSSETEQAPQYASFDEMILEKDALYDNGYPIIISPKPDFGRDLRCSLYHMKTLTDDELIDYQTLPEKTDGALDVISLDCEMIETDKGDELARLSVVDSNGVTVIDEYFRPVGEIVDLRTNKSGITIELIEEKARTHACDCLSILSRVADRHTIIIGHSLENDMRSMRMIHERVIDTALLFSFEVPFPGKPSLARLYQKYIKKPFRAGTTGHDSTEDARAALELAKYAMTAPASCRGTPQVITDILKSNVRVDVIASTDTVLSIQSSADCPVSTGTGTDYLTEKVVEALEEAPPVVMAYFDDLATCHATDHDQGQALARYNDALANIKNNLPSQSVLIVYTGNGNLHRISHLTEGTPEFSECREGLLWIYTN